MEKHNLQWFLDRIGSRVYRSASTCTCVICKKVEEVGLIIDDRTHANYLYDCQNDLDLIYSDEPILKNKNK